MVRLVGCTVLLVVLAVSGVLAAELDDQQQEYSDSGTDYSSNKDALDEAMMLPIDGLKLEHEIVTMQSDQPISGERFVAIHVEHLGGTEELNPKLVGVSNMAISFLPADHRLVDILSATRQVVNGVRYDLLLNAITNETQPIVCLISVLEQPWLVTQFGEKKRSLIHTNCTSEEYGATAVNDANNFNFNPVFVNTGTMTDDSIKEIEEQIVIPKAKKNRTTKKPPLTDFDDYVKGLEDQIVQMKTTSTTEVVPSEDSDVSGKHSFPTNNVDNGDEALPLKNNSTGDVVGIVTTNPGTDSSMEGAGRPLDDRSKNVLDDFFNVDMNYLHQTPNANVQEYSNTKHSEVVTHDVPEDKIAQKQIKAVSNDDVTTVKSEYVSENPLKIDLKDIHQSDSKPSDMLVDSDKTSQLAAKSQPCSIDQHSPTPNIAGAKMSIESDASTTASTKSVPNDIFENLSKTNDVSSTTPHPLSILNESISGELKKLLATRISSDDVIVPSPDLQVTDNIEPTVNTSRSCSSESSSSSSASSGDECIKTEPVVSRRKRQSSATEAIYIRDVSRKSLLQLDAVDSDDNKRILLDVLRSNKKVNADGTTNFVLALRVANSHCVEDESFELDESCTVNLVEGSSKICNVEVRVKRNNEVTVTKSICSPDKRTRRQVGIPGAPVPADESEIRDVINHALSGVAARPDGNVYSLKSIEKSSRQVVAGLLYKIKGSFITNDKPVDCDLSVWTRPWLNLDEVTLECENQPKYNFEMASPPSNNEQASRSKRSLRPLLDSEETLHEPYKSSADLADERKFSNFIADFNRTYTNLHDYQFRLRTFKSNLRKIENLNNHELGTAEYGVNQFADMTESEFKKYTGLRPRLENWETNDLSHPMADIPDEPLPRSFDWREKNVISAVKNQGSCGSCWAFSVTGNIEGLHAIKTGKLEEYSEQELVDCDTIDSGCNGGLFDNAYKALEQLGGLELESDYPYTGKGQQCHFNKTKVHVRVTGAVDLPQNETSMAQWLVVNGPLSIGINANGMQFYRGGVSHPWKQLCSHKSIDHGVLIVGFGVSEYPLFNKTMPYWIVKNSWGPMWGEQGYYRVFRGDNTCGLATMVSSAVLE